MSSPANTTTITTNSTNAKRHYHDDDVSDDEMFDDNYNVSTEDNNDHDDHESHPFCISKDFEQSLIEDHGSTHGERVSITTIIIIITIIIFIIITIIIKTITICRRLKGFDSKAKGFLVLLHSL